MVNAEPAAAKTQTIYRQTDRSEAAAEGWTLRQLGPYRILETLGTGGMGTVYLAEQHEPVYRRVALKVLNDHRPRSHRRFAIEGAALARLSHPNVASLYDCGITDEDLPFMAMELVEGTIITEWCEARRLGLRQRVELVINVCRGVRHAHEKGILHRDLKPSNVLVTEFDGRPVAKVIDFGIASSIDEPPRGSGSGLTGEELVGSPGYMSPEAFPADADGPMDVDTRSDVYSLGLVFYELAAGVSPFGAHGSPIEILLRRLSEKVPPVASVRFAGLPPDERLRIAAQRSLAPRKLERLLRGDLDAILAKALEYHKDRRYSSPADLADDLERWLGHFPVLARPSSVGYRTARFVRRRLGTVTAAALLVLSLTAGLVTSLIQVGRTHQEIERTQAALAEARQVSDFLVDLFEVADPERSPGAAATPRELLDRGAERLREELADQPLARARLLYTIGTIYTRMALFEPAEELMAESLKIRRAELPEGHPDRLESLNQLGVIYRRAGRLDEAEPLLRQVLESLETAPRPDPIEVAMALNNLGNLQWSRNQADDAATLHRRALEIRRRHLEPDHPDLALSLHNLGAVLQQLGRWDEAERVLQEALGIFEASLGKEHPRTVASVLSLGAVAQARGRWDEAETRYRRVHEAWRKAYGPIHPHTRRALRSLARLLSTLGRHDESVALLRDLLEAQRQADDPAMTSTMNSLAIALGRGGDVGGAEEVFTEQLGIWQARGIEPGHREMLRTRVNLVWVAELRGHLEAAEQGYREMLDTLGEGSLLGGFALHHLGLVLTAQGHPAEARPILSQALEIRERLQGEDHLEVASILHALGEIAVRDQRPEEARQYLERALAIRQQKLPAEHRDLRHSAALLASLP